MARYRDRIYLVEDVRRNGVIVIRMGDVRDAYGSERLGRNVRKRITLNLRTRGLAHVPAQLPAEQNQLIVIYDRRNGPVSELIGELSGGPEAPLVQMTSFISQLIRVASEVRVKLDKVQAVLVDGHGTGAANPGSED